MDQDEQAQERFYPLWKAWGMSFFSRDLYRDVAANWKGTAYGSLFLTIFLLSILRGFTAQEQFSAEIPGFMQKIPPFKITQGVLSTDVPQPYRIDYKEDALVIDTTGRYTTLTAVPGYADLKALWLVTGTQIMDHRVRLGNAQDKIRKMPGLKSFVATREDLDRWAGMIVNWSGVTIFLFLTIFWSMSNGVTLLLYALLGVFIADVRKGNIDFKDSLRLAVVSHFPAMILLTFLGLLKIDLSWSLLWTFLMSLGYLIFAVSSLDLSEGVEVITPKRKVVRKKR